jgi:hypothetical protein
MGSKESDLAKWRDLRDQEYSTNREVAREATAQAKILKEHLYSEHNVISPDAEAPPSSQPWLEPKDRD